MLLTPNHAVGLQNLRRYMSRFRRKRRAFLLSFRSLIKLPGRSRTWRSLSAILPHHDAVMEVLSQLRHVLDDFSESAIDALAGCNLRALERIGWPKWSGATA